MLKLILNFKLPDDLLKSKVNENLQLFIITSGVIYIQVKYHSKKLQTSTPCMGVNLPFGLKVDSANFGTRSALVIFCVFTSACKAHST